MHLKIQTLTLRCKTWKNEAEGPTLGVMGGEVHLHRRIPPRRRLYSGGAVERSERYGGCHARLTT